MADKIDISSFQIAASKMRADGNAYFKLFEKHVPRNLDQDSVVLLYKLDNLSCICKIINMNIKAHYIVVSNTAVNTALRAVLDKSIDVKYIEELDFKKTDMKFDCIIQNPPYVRNLHLKILAEAIKHLKDEKSVCVNLSPVRWLQDPLAKYKKNCDLKRFEESVAKYIESLEIVDKISALQMFDAGFTMNLGIYKCVSNKSNYDYLAISANSIVTKVMSKMQTSIADKVEYNKLNGWRVRVNEIQPLEACDKRDPSTQSWRHFLVNPNTPTYVYNNGYTKDGVFWTDLVQKGKYTKNKGDPLVLSIPFSTEQEAFNFEAFCKTTFMNALKNLTQQDIHVPLFAFPFLGNAINPRTGLKGYTGEWTDDDLVLYFDITPEEYNIIKKTMEKYK